MPVTRHPAGVHTPSSRLRAVRAVAAAAFAGLLTAALPAGAQDHIPSSAGDIVLTPLVHASVRIDFAGRTIYLDPWSAVALTAAPQSSLIIVTDADAGAHHLDVAAIRTLRAAGGTVVVPAAGKTAVPDGVVLPNGTRRTFGDVTVESIAAYDIIPGEPSHPKGDANGYLLTLGGTRVYFAGVTECVPELKALTDIDVAFMPMNLPLGRMKPEAVADCVRAFKPKVVYPYHYDQGYQARLAGRGDVNGGAPAAESVKTLRDLLRGIADVRSGNWYPAR